MESTSNQYGPCVSSLARTQLGAASSAARTSSEEPPAAGGWRGRRRSVPTVVVRSPPPPHAAISPLRDTVPPNRERAPPADAQAARRGSRRSRPDAPGLEHLARAPRGRPSSTAHAEVRARARRSGGRRRQLVGRRLAVGAGRARRRRADEALAQVVRRVHRDEAPANGDPGCSATQRLASPTASSSTSRSNVVCSGRQASSSRSRSRMWPSSTTSARCSQLPWRTGSPSPCDAGDRDGPEDADAEAHVRHPAPRVVVRLGEHGQVRRRPVRVDLGRVPDAAQPHLGVEAERVEHGREQRHVLQAVAAAALGDHAPLERRQVERRDAAERGGDAREGDRVDVRAVQAPERGDGGRPPSRRETDVPEVGGRNPCEPP